MKTTAEVVVIGGGVIGTSLLFNLGQLGVTDTLLVEKDVLGSGSTGRSQTMCRMHYSNPVTAVMAWKSLDIFRNFRDMVGGESGFVETGYLLVVNEQDRGALNAMWPWHANWELTPSRSTPKICWELPPRSLSVKTKSWLGNLNRVMLTHIW